MSTSGVHGDNNDVCFNLLTEEGISAKIFNRDLIRTVPLKISRGGCQILKDLCGTLLIIMYVHTNVHIGVVLLVK